MDFFDNALNKAKDAIDIACSKTDKIVTEQKQKFDIAALKKKRKVDFENLGKIYYKKECGEEVSEDDIKSLIDKITDKNKKIKELRDEIEAAKNDGDEF